MEHIRQIYRQSPFVLLHALILSFLAIVIPAYLIFKYDAPGFIVTLLWAWIIVVTAHLLRVILIWRLNRYVVTNQRLLQYTQKGFFDQKVIETPHERVLNVSYQTEGFVSYVFGYGNVVVQVVGLMEPIVLKNISTPMEIKDYLWEMHKRVAENQNNNLYANTDASHLQERVGYSKSKF